MLIGDVLAVVAILGGMAFSAWAVLIGSALLFRRKARIARSLIEHAAGRSFSLGLFLLFAIGIVSIALLSVPLPAVKFFGWSGLLVVLSLASVGGGGLVLLVSERLQQYDPQLPAFAALSRAALFIVAAGLVPLLGLFIVFPAVLALGVGTTVQAIFMRQELSPSASYTA